YWAYGSVASEDIAARTQRLAAPGRQHRIGGKNHASVVARRRQQRLKARHLGDAKPRRAALPRAQNLAATAQVMILLGDEKAVLGVLHHLQALAGRLAKRGLVEQHAEALARASADAPAQLMQLRQAEAFGMLDDHDVGVGYVDADLDHRSRYENFQPAVGERLHGGVLGLVLHAAMQQPDIFLAEKLRQMR